MATNKQELLKWSIFTLKRNQDLEIESSFDLYFLSLHTPCDCGPLVFTVSCVRTACHRINIKYNMKNKKHCWKGDAKIDVLIVCLFKYFVLWLHYRREQIKYLTTKTKFVQEVIWDVALTRDGDWVHLSFSKNNCKALHTLELTLTEIVPTKLKDKIKALKVQKQKR